MDTEQRLSKILIVDDTPENIQLLGTILRTNGYQIIVAQDGLQVFDAIERVMPDLILLDIMMPKIDGFGVCEKLKADEKTRDIPVIFLTAKNEMDDVVKGFQLGAVDYIVKPFQMTELLARVKTHLDLKYFRDALAVRVEEVSRMKREHEALLRHELNNQLMPIMGYAQLLLDIDNQNLSEEQQQRIEIIFENSQRLARVIEGLRHIQSLEEGTLQIKLDEVHLGELLDNIVADLIVGFDQDAIVSIDNRMQSSEIRADDSMLEGALKNLIKNAIEHVSHLPDEKAREIHITLVDQYDQVLIDINNGGTPIPADRLARFFEKFNTDREHKADGTGLGTTYAYWVVKAHQGDIGVTSLEGEGTTVSLCLPKNLA